MVIKDRADAISLLPTYRTIFHTGFDIPEIVVQTYKPEVDESFEALRAAWCKSLGARHDFAEDDESAVWISSVATRSKRAKFSFDDAPTCIVGDWVAHADELVW